MTNCLKCKHCYIAHDFVGIGKKLISCDSNFVQTDKSNNCKNYEVKKNDLHRTSRNT